MMNKILFGTFFVGAVFIGSISAPVNVFAQVGDGCALSANERMNAAKQTAVNNVTSSNDGVTAEDFSCQNTSGISSSLVETRCVTGLCSGGRDNRCCIPGTAGVRPGAGGEAPSGGGAPTPRVRGGLVLPACVSDGNCQLDDIIQTGVNFANFLFGISGAVFLAIFVYAGILYLTSGGSAERAGKGKKMLTQAAIGMLIVVGAGVMVTFVYNAFRGGSGDRCEVAHSGFTCATLPSENLSEEIRNRGCVTGLCPGGSTNVCCPSR